MKTYSMLADYQREMRRRFIEQPAVLGAVDMGMGKTVCALSAIKVLLKRAEVEKVLVVAPIRVAENTWPDELAEWEHLSSLRCSVLTGPPSQRAAAATSDAPIHVINRENLVWLDGFWGDSWPYDMLVYDEASRLKSGKKKTAGGVAGWDKTLDWTGKPWPDRWPPETQRILRSLLLSPIGGLKKKELLDDADVGPYHVEKLVNAGVLAPSRRERPPSPPQLSEFGVLVKRRSEFKRVIELSGTPSPNGLEDLWGPAFLLDKGQRLGRSKHQFTQRWFKKDYSGFRNVPLPHAEREITEALSDVTFSMAEADYKVAHDVRHNIVPVKLSAKDLKAYRKFKKDLYAEEYDVEAVNKGVLVGKLLQFANGSMYRGEEKEVIPVHTRKLDALDSIIAESGGDQVLLAYSFRFDLDAIRRRYPKAVVFDEEPDFVRKWNNGEVGLGLAHPASIGHGLNLQHGGRIAVWYGLTWSLELYQQFNKRLPRPGQTKQVIIHHILAEETEDFRQYQALNTKGETQARFLASVKA